MFKSQPFFTLFTILAAMLALLLSSNSAFAWQDRIVPPEEPPPHDEFNSHITTAQVIAALDLAPANVVSVTFDKGLLLAEISSHVGYNRLTGSAAGFPLAGADYMALSTGFTASALLANTAPFTSGTLAGLNNPRGQDMVQMRLVLAPPAGTSSLTFNFRYFSEEFPEFITQFYHDPFIVELAASTFTITGTLAAPVMSAPNNVVYNPLANIMKTNATGVLALSAANSVGTTYDGGTSMLCTTVPFPAGSATITLIFSIMDFRDSNGDTTVFLDNFRWACATGSPVTDTTCFEPSCNEPPACSADFTDADANFLVSGQYIVTEGRTITVPFTGTDADGDVLTVSLSGPGSLTALAGAAPLATTWSWTPTAADASGGPYTISVTFEDPDGETATCSFVIPDVNLNPTANCFAHATSGGGPSGDDITVDCDSFLGREVTLDATGSSDLDGDTLSYHWDVSNLDVSLGNVDAISTSGMFPIGVTMATVTVTDGRGGVAFCDVTVGVQDTHPPDVECTTSMAALWPPRHDMRAVTLTIRATDVCAVPSFVIPIVVNIRSDEPDNVEGVGDGNTTGDVNGTDGFAFAVNVSALLVPGAESGTWTAVVMLRAERDGTQDGRKYTIDVAATDSAMNIAITSCCVVVPHDRRGG